jgi:hypothetical protein
MNVRAQHPGAICALLLLLGACGPAIAGDDDGSSSSAAEMSATSATEPSSGDPALPSESSSDDAGPSPESSSTGGEGTTGIDDDVCIGYCEVVDACRESGEPGCLDACHVFHRFRAENYDDACQAASTATQSCIAGLTCDEYEAYGCEAEGIAESGACSAGTRPQAGLHSFCTMVAGCGAVPYDLCVVDLLDYNIRESYELGCEVEYEAFLACSGALSCAEYQDEAMMEAICAAELAAVDAACPTFGQD